MSLEYNNIISLGDHCVNRILMDELKKTTNTYPFDWVVHVNQLHDTNIPQNIDMLEELLINNNVDEVTKKYIGDAINREDKLSNNVWFPHESGTSDEVYEKYKRRFQRLYDNITKGDVNIYMITTRIKLIEKEHIDKLMNIITKYNTNSKLVFISGGEHDYMKDYPNIIYKYIPYDASQFYGYDYSYFRPHIKFYLENLFANSNKI
ncbi:MAG: hypothetical protein Terrestrivirus1_78 [Terrestrivirus sp.]|uniref:Papain-like cysteine peptidase n=1 Tax=Terrestrivirus sp. TaxID=2487775 RepID=A0A3G4ZLC2_9VIRU|nr:MAG: hypothetical protein Terrestrivirus1_78 [Terrestrivirus sp.]